MFTKEQEVMERRYTLPYNWLHASSSRRFRYKQGLFFSALRLAPNLNGKKILDAGCGDGWYSARLVEQGSSVTGVDYSIQAVEFARLIVKNATFQEASLTKLPFLDDTFDVIFVIQVLEHIPPLELSLAISELARILKKDGVCVVSVPSIRRPLSKAHVQHFTHLTLAAALEPAFTVRQMIGYRTGNSFFTILEKISENRFWFLSFFARLLDQFFYRFFAYTTPEKGENLVVSLSKKNV